ncbi:MAG: DnaB-like helicase C-terminal domain-containing protein [Candidatus Auribacterota bacterium]|nr:DnaB-like helicase C-terminal domain-containing protein [Candidatus Auribacterota bacterium]
MTNKAEDFVFHPQAVSRLAIKQIKKEQEKKPYLKLGIPQIDDHFVMMRAGKLIGVLADTSHGKSSFMTFIARQMIQQFDDPKDIGVYVTWEDTVEDFGITDISALSAVPISSVYNGEVTETQFANMLKSATQRATSPLWVLGHSETRRTSRPRLTMTDVILGLEYIIHEQKRNIRFVMFDYLQLINLADIRERDTRLRYSEAVNKMKDMAQGYGIISICATQVKRQISERKWKMPQIHDAMETSRFEHACDGMIGLWYVHRTEELGKLIYEPKGRGEVPVYCTEDLMLYETLKQKKGKAMELRALDFIPEYNAFKSYNTGNQYRQKKNGK